MRKSTVLAVVVISMTALSALAAEKGKPAPKPGGDEAGFVSLFDGKTLNGWEGDPRFWSVENGVIVGTTDKTPTDHNTFLCSTKEYSNFVLKIEFKLRNHNSGVQVRSKRLDDFVVTGYQADIAEKRYMGILYEEKGRGILVDVDPEEVAPHVNWGDWNEYVIVCKGPHIQQYLNGYKTVDYVEKDSEHGATKGIIALQVHRGPAMRVEFRNIRIKELPDVPAQKEKPAK
ncbi:MAG: DUF1080 domain-containing protein [Planctomycetota bacterium]|nr:MAG: DUF1080 domain-containing protein [Planctomycetota bacterium]